MFASDWEAKARSELQAARALADQPLWGQAFYHAGFAVECALKFRIMRVSGLNRWPRREERRDLYSHDLQKLAELALIETAVTSALLTDDPLGLNWLVAMCWNSEARYDPRPFPSARCRDMMDSVDGGMAVENLTPGRDVELTDERRMAGAAILKMTDDVGFQASGAAWVFNAESAHWHFLLVSHMIDSEGPRWVYERLLKVFTKYRLPDGITPLDILIASPREIAFCDMPILKDDENWAGVATVTDMTLGVLPVDFIAIYRMRKTPVNAGEKTRAFDRRVAQLMAA